MGEQYGKVRALINDRGDRVDEAGPSVPVEVLGLNGTPEAGDVLNVVSTDAQAREIAEYREKAAKDKRAAAGAATSLEQLMANAKENENVSEMPVVVKADVQGSAEAIVQAMEKIGNEEVRVRVLHSGCRRHYRERYRPGRSLRCAGLRLQRPGQRARTEFREPEGCGDPVLLGDLRPSG